MKMYLKAIAITGILAIILFAGIFYLKNRSYDSAEISKLNSIDQMEGEGLKDFKVKTLEEVEVGPLVFKGKIVLVHFWASWCGPCLTEFPSLISLVEKMDGQLQLIAISGDDNTTDIQTFLKAFPKAKNPNIHIVWDSDKGLSKLYAVDRLPESFLGNREGKLSKKIVGSIDWNSADTLEYLKAL